MIVAAFDDVIRTRRTTRAFRADPVPRESLERILALASTAPSTFNTQPWRVIVLIGDAKLGLSRALLEAHAANACPAHAPLPHAAPAECTRRLLDFGRRYYTALDIDRNDVAARARQTGRNFEFFDAPVGMIFTIHRALTEHSWLDYGLFLQNLMLAAHANGLATCPQVSFVRYESVIARQLGLSAEERVVCGLSLGYPDPEAAVNRLDMPRDQVDARWLGFGPVRQAQEVRSLRARLTTSRPSGTDGAANRRMLGLPIGG